MTTVTISGDKFLINGEPTYSGRSWRGWPIEGLLMNSRMVQATFDDENGETAPRWAYPDSGVHDPERNTSEFIAAVPGYRSNGLLAVTVNMQGGSPEGYSNEQPWINTAFTADGTLKPGPLDRMRRVIEALDANGMVAILGLFYFGQDQHLADETAVFRAVETAVNWVLDMGYGNVLIEVNNECDVPRYSHSVLMPARVHELIDRVRGIGRGERRLLVGTSFRGDVVPTENVVRSSDFLLMHGNGVADPVRIAAMVDQVRAVPGYRPMPVLFNEDDHFNFTEDWNNCIAAVSRFASWGFFDPGENDYHDGYQSPPVQWLANTSRKQGFFDLVNRITRD